MGERFVPTAARVGEEGQYSGEFLGKYPGAAVGAMRPDLGPDRGPGLAPGRKRNATRPPKSKLSPRWRAGIATAESVLMWLAGAAVVATLAARYEQSLASAAVLPGVKIFGEDAAGMSSDEAQSLAEREAEAKLDRPMTLHARAQSFESSARELGARPATEGAGARALAVGREDGLLGNLRARAMARAGASDLVFGMDFEPRHALAKLREIAPSLELAPTPQRLDLEARQLIEAQAGHALLADASLSRVAVALASDRSELDLEMLERPPELGERERKQAALKVDVLLGEFATPYNQEARARDRTHNLKLGAAAIDGTIIEPGQVWSFNETVGERSAERGYRYATGINGGELVDVLGGGICQVASSMFGASFFGGLEVVRARPHSRPSSYVDMGLDATVVWPTVDLKIRNTYDFPVVLHMTVNQGRVVAQVLGPRRPFQVRFERELKSASDFELVQRSDEKLRVGARRVSQRGVRGFKLERRRVFVAGGKEVKRESWELSYPPTRQIEYVGTNPSGTVPDNKSFPNRREPDKDLRILQ